jgi:hypothetical protein
LGIIVLDWTGVGVEKKSVLARTYKVFLVGLEEGGLGREGYRLKCGEGRRRRKRERFPFLI